jgi:hypothetical protein
VNGKIPISDKKIAKSGGDKNITPKSSSGTSEILCPLGIRIKNNPIEINKLAIE